MVKLLSVIAGVSMISLVGSASAGDIITLGESQMEAVTAAGGVSYNSHGFDFYGNKIVLENIKKNLDVYVKIKGNYAQGMRRRTRLAKTQTPSHGRTRRRMKDTVRVRFRTALPRRRRHTT